MSLGADKAEARLGWFHCATAQRATCFEPLTFCTASRTVSMSLVPPPAIDRDVIFLAEKNIRSSKN